MDQPKMSFIGFRSKKEEVKIFHMYLCAMRVLIGTRPNVETQSDMKKLVQNMILRKRSGKIRSRIRNYL